MEYTIYKGEDELMHWGVRGMRWGVRRYQNKDGSLTAAGKKKLRAETAKVREQEQINKNRKATQAKFDRLAARKKAADDEKKALDNEDAAKKGKGKKSADTGTQPTKKSIKDMTDAELANAVYRSRLEDEYRRYNPEPAPKRGFMNDVMDNTVKPAVLNAGRQFIQDAITKVGKDLLKDKVDPNSLEALENAYKKLDFAQKIDKIRNPDKYLSEEDKNKRQEREFKAEDRAAQKAGFKDAAAKAAADRQEEQRRKDYRTATRKSANKAKQNGARLNPDDYDFGFDFWGSVNSSPSSSNVNTSRTANSSQSGITRLLSSSASQTPSTVRQGRTTVQDLLDRNGNVILTMEYDD